MAENVKVIVRCRPMSEKERNMRCKVSDNDDHRIKFYNCIVKIIQFPISEHN